MRRVLIIGPGDVATRAIPWLRQRFQVCALVRRPEEAQRLRALGVRPLAGDLDQPATLRRLSGVADAILHCAPPPNHGEDDPRTRHLLAAVARPRHRPCRTGRRQPRRATSLSRLVYISTTGVYGDHAGGEVRETTPVSPQQPRARRRVAAEHRLRQAARRQGWRLAILRAPGIYAADRLPRERLLQGVPALQAADDVHTNHIHADDLARLACLALFRARPLRVINAVDQSALRMADYFDVVAAALGLPPPPRVPRAELAGLLSPMALSFMQESRRIVAPRLAELRATLRYPTVGHLLATL